MTRLLIEHGLILLFVLVGLESAGVPLPGETALVAAALLAERGHYSIVWVVAVAAAAAVAGDNVGYWIGRVGGRKLLRRWAPLRRWTDRVLPPSERFFRRHGAKTVFIGRFFALLRVTAAWLAGVSKMPWWRFFVWNAAGGICWAALVGLVAYYAGEAAVRAVDRYGLFAGVAIAFLLVASLVALHLLQRRAVDDPGREAAAGGETREAHGVTPGSLAGD